MRCEGSRIAWVTRLEGYAVRCWQLRSHLARGSRSQTIAGTGLWQAPVPQTELTVPPPVHPPLLPIWHVHNRPFCPAPSPRQHSAVQLTQPLVYLAAVAQIDLAAAAGMVALLAADEAALAVPERGLSVVASFARDVGAAGVARLQIAEQGGLVIQCT